MKARLNKYAQNKSEITTRQNNKPEGRGTDVFRIDLQMVNIQNYNL